MPSSNLSPARVSRACSAIYVSLKSIDSTIPSLAFSPYAPCVLHLFNLLLMNHHSLALGCDFVLLLFVE